MTPMSTEYEKKYRGSLSKHGYGNKKKTRCSRQQRHAISIFRVALFGCSGTDLCKQTLILSNLLTFSFSNLIFWTGSNTISLPVTRYGSALTSGYCGVQRALVRPPLMQSNDAGGSLLRKGLLESLRSPALAGSTRSKAH